MTALAPVRRPVLVSPTAQTPRLVAVPSHNRSSAVRHSPAATSTARRQRPRAFFAFVTACVMFAVMVAQMLLSVALESGAYEIAHLQKSNTEATRTLQQVSQDIDRLSSPGHLAVNAEALGMLSNNTPAYLRLSDGAILGSPSAGDGFTSLVAADGGSLVPNSLLVGVPIVTTAASPALTSDDSGSSLPGALVGAPAEIRPAGPVALSNGLPGLVTH